MSRRPGAASRPRAGNVRPGAGGERERVLTPPRRPGTPQVWRLAGVALVLALLGVILFPTVSGYVGQRNEIAATERQIVSQQQEIAELQQQVERWEDPEFVERQARERLRFVHPGEVAFTVLDDTGELLTEPLPGMTPVTIEVHESRPWYGEVWESVKVANEGVPAGERDADR